MRQKLEPQIFTESTDFHVFPVLIRRIRVNPWFLFVAEPMIIAVLRFIIREAFVSMPVANDDLYSTA
jgi:hypothetical protein